MKDDSSQTSNLSQQEKDSKFSKIDLLATYLINNKTIFSNEQRKNLSHDLEEILLNCSFNNEPCDSSDFVWKFHRVRNFQSKPSKKHIAKKNMLRVPLLVSLCVDFVNF